MNSALKKIQRWRKNIPGIVIAAINWFVEPSASVKPEQRRRVRLLSTFLILMTLNTLIGSGFLKNINGGVWAFMLATSLVLFSSYLISRTRYYRIAVIMAVTVPAVPPLVMVALKPPEINLTAELMWLALPLLVSSLMMTVRESIIVAVAYIVFIIMLSIFGSLSYDIVAPLSAFILVIAFFEIGIAVAREKGQTEIEKQMTERLQIEKDLRSSEAKLADEAIRHRILIEQSRDGIVILDQNGAVYQANRRFAEMLGYSHEETSKLNVWDWEFLFPRDRVIEMIRTVDEAGDHFETQHRRKDGSVYDVEISTNGAIFAGQKLIFCVCRDITERKQMEKALRESEEKFSKAFHASPEMVAITRIKDGTFVDINDSYTQRTGYSREELIGNTTTAIGIWANNEDRAKMTRLLEERGRVVNQEFDFRMKSGENRTWMLSLEPITIGGESCLIGVSVDITERKQMENALRESEEKFSKAFHASPDAISISTLTDGTFLEVNDSYTRITGYSRGELIFKNADSLNMWTNPEQQDRMLRKIHDGVKIHDEEFDFRTKSGDIRTMLLSTEYIQIGGQPCLLVVSSDITERKRIEKALEESEEKFAIAFRSSPEMITIMDPETNQYLELNDSYAKTIGYSREELMSHKVDEIPMWVKSEELQKITHALQTEGKINNQEFSFRTKSGEILQWLCSAEMVTIGGKLRTLAVATDITERKRIEMALRESEEKFSKAFQALPEAISISTIKDGIFLEVNDSFVSLNGYSREEVIGHKSKELDIWVNSGDRYRIKQLMEKQGRFENDEFMFRRKSGEIRTVLLSADIINVGGKPCILTIGTDITERKRKEEKLKQALVDLERSSAQLKATNKELESFSYSVSHDLRSPLRSIDGFSQAMLEDYAAKLDTKGQDYLKRLRGASQKMGELIDGLLKLSRLTRSEMHQEKVDLSILANEIAARLQETHPKRHAKFIIGSDLTADGDPQMLRVLLENLLGNAFKFTAKKPHVVIEFGSAVSDGKKTFFIKDNGAGFDMAFKDKLFGAFQRLHDTAEFPGTGIGLATVQRIINRHGGSIRAEGAVNKGATFYFTLT
jgi:PAS domain S-box-containing protein